MNMREKPDYTKPWLILCEGQGDKHIFCALIESLNLQGKFDVVFPYPSSGRGGFGKFLKTLYDAEPNFSEHVKAVLIISDNDEDRERSFGEISSGLEKTNLFGVPIAERTIAVRTNSPAPKIIVLMIPIDNLGNIETLCVEAAYSKWEIKPALDEYVNGTQAGTWGIGKQSKMRMHCILAATCLDNPGVSLTNLGREKPEFHIPIDDAAFKEISDFLVGFEAFLEA